MKLFNQLLNHLSILNSGHDISARSTGVKFFIVVGILVVIALAATGIVSSI